MSLLAPAPCDHCYQGMYVMNLSTGPASSVYLKTTVSWSTGAMSGVESTETEYYLLVLIRYCDLQYLFLNYFFQFFTTVDER